MAGKTSSSYNRRAHFTCIWKILSSNKDHCYCSPEFTIPSVEMTKWRVDLIFNDDGTPAFGTIQRMQDDGPKSIQIEFELAYFDCNGSTTIRNSSYFRKNYATRDYEFPEMIEARSDCCPKDSVTLRCRIWRKGTEISKPELCFASTHFDVYQRNYVWAVKRFSLVLQGEKKTRTLNGNIKSCPQLILTLSLAKNNGQECVFLHLEAPHLTEAFVIKAETSLFDAEGMMVLSKQERVVIVPFDRIYILAIFEKSELKRPHLLSDDVLLLQCKLKLTTGNPVWRGVDDYRLMDYSVDSKVLQNQEDASQCLEPKETAVCPFTENIGKFMEDGTFSDVCLRAGTKSFPAHKLILSSRSPVFRKMFTSASDMGEKTSNNCIDIPELDADTLKRLLLYIYKDEVEELTWENAANLLEAADRYELTALKEKCCCVLKSNLSLSNILRILPLAKKYKDESLNRAVEEFVRNSSAINNLIRFFEGLGRVFEIMERNPNLEQIISNMK